MFEKQRYRLLPTKIMDKLFETNFRFHVKWRTMGIVQYSLFNNFSQVFSFWQEDWALGYNFMLR